MHKSNSNYLTLVEVTIVSAFCIPQHFNRKIFIKQPVGPEASIDKESCQEQHDITKAVADYLPYNHLPHIYDISHHGRYLHRPPEVLAGMPGKVGTSQQVIKDKECQTMPNSVQDHVDLAPRPGDQLSGGDQCEGVAGVGAGHPAGDSLEDVDQKRLAHDQ